MSDHGGHKVPNCPGFWIDVSTLVQPRFYMCSECRATRRTKPDVDLDEPLLEPTGDDYEGDGGFSMLGWSLVAVSAIIVIGVLWWIVHLR